MPSFLPRKITVKKRERVSACEGIKRFNCEHEWNTQWPSFKVMTNQVSASKPCHPTTAPWRVSRVIHLQCHKKKPTDITTAQQHLALLLPKGYKAADTTNIWWYSCAGGENSSRAPCKTTWPRTSRALFCLARFSIITLHQACAMISHKFHINSGRGFCATKHLDSPLAKNNIIC